MQQVVTGFDRAVGHGAPDAAGNDHGARACDVGKHHQELFARVADQHVFLAQGGAHEVGEALQHLVADLLAEVVVQPAQVVDVQHDHRQRLVGSARA